MNENAMLAARPGNTFDRLFGRIPKYIRFTFLASFALCILIHHQAYSGLLLNLDNLGHMFGTDYGTASGRWLLPAVTALDGDFSAPWLLGTLSALMLSVSVCLAVSLMRVRSRLGCLLTAAFLIAFPSITSNSFYTFSADAYMLSLALACLGAYLTVKYRWGFMGGAAAFCLSMGIYQSYFCVGATLLVGSLIFDLLDGDKSAWEVLKRGLKYLLPLIIGLGAYYLAVKLTTRETGLADYMGISSMGRLELSELPATVSWAYAHYRDYYLRDITGVHTALTKLCFLASMAAAGLMGVTLIIRRGLDWKKLLLLAVLVVLFPLAANSIRVMAPMSTGHILMTYGIAMVPAFAIALGDYFAAAEKASPPGKAGGLLGTVCLWVLVLSAGIMSFGYAVKANEVYLKSEIVQEESVAFGNRLLMSAQLAEGYEAQMPLVLVGSSEAEFTAAPELEKADITGVFDMTSLIRSYTYGLFLQRCCGWTEEVYIDGSEVTGKYAKMPELEDMPVYPGQGSVRVIDGAVVVKLS